MESTANPEPVEQPPAAAARAEWPRSAPRQPGFRHILRVRLLWTTLALLLVYSGIFALVVLIPLVWRDAAALFASQTQTVRARVDAALNDVAATEAMLIATWREVPPSLDDPSDFINHARGVVEELPAATSVVLGNARGQGWMLLWHPDRGEWWVRLTDRARWGDEQRFIALDITGRELRRWHARVPYDPRERAWYRLATDVPGRTRWTHPYRFYTTQEPGITGARAWRDASDVVWALGVDLRLTEIDAIAAALPRPPRGRLAITDADGHRLALAGGEAAALAPAAASSPSGSTQALERLDRVADPILRALATRANPGGGMAVAWLDGEGWLWTHQPVALDGTRFGLWLAVPWASLLPSPWAWLTALLVGLVFALVVGLWLMRRWGDEMAQPTETLANAAHRMARLHFDAGVPTRWFSAEFHTLALALNRLRRRLAVYTGKLRRREAELAREVAALMAAEQRLIHVGLHDTLTGLPNRRLLMEQLQLALARAGRSGQQLGLLFVDLDHFKEVNDTRGHEIGDELLQEVARRLASHVRAGDIAARCGGDEFVLLLENVSAEVAVQRAEGLLDVLRAPIDAGGERWTLGASIGIALGPRDGGEATALLRHADEALYRAKRAGRNRWVLYEDGFSQATAETHALRVLLQNLLEGGSDGGLELWWQPQVALDRGVAVSAEALLRWRHPERGWIPPAEFIPLAEDAGLMPALGWRVLDLALAAAPALARAQPLWRHLAVNVSTRQLDAPGFAEGVIERLQRTAWPAERLEIEVTESALLESESARAQLQRLADIGVRLALDDFGTGYSSLSYLRRLPFDVVKIDASFVRDIGNSAQADALIESLIAMAKALGLALVAEGVQTAAQRDFLVARGVDMGQGYLWSRPQPLAHWLQG